jgi:hypothetical protein
MLWKGPSTTAEAAAHCAFVKISPDLLLQVIAKIGPHRVRPFSGEMSASRVRKLPTAIVMSAEDEIEAAAVGLH